MTGQPAVRVELGDWNTIGELAMPLRMRVFVEEQGVPEALELDEFDPVSRHALVRDADGTVLATGRLLPDGRIGRMAVDVAWRGRGLGGAVLEALLQEAVRRGLASVLLHAQVHAMPFYARHGFGAEGEIFMEAGTAHCLMRRTLSDSPDDDA